MRRSTDGRTLTHVEHSPTSGGGGTVVPWGTFRQTFLENVPEDVKNRKEMELLELK